jgi:hypothetical protein
MIIIYKSRFVEKYYYSEKFKQGYVRYDGPGWIQCEGHYQNNCYSISIARVYTKSNIIDFRYFVETVNSNLPNTKTDII